MLSDAAIKALKLKEKMGMTFGAPGPIDMGHMKSVHGRDPEGNVIELQQAGEHCDFRLDRLSFPT